MNHRYSSRKMIDVHRHRRKNSHQMKRLFLVNRRRRRSNPVIRWTYGGWWAILSRPFGYYYQFGGHMVLSWMYVSELKWLVTWVRLNKTASEAVMTSEAVMGIVPPRIATSLSRETLPDSALSNRATWPLFTTLICWLSKY